jgi:hypothetical protein
MKPIPSLAWIVITLGLMTAGAMGQVITPDFNNYSAMLGGTTADYVWNGFNAATPPAGLEASINGAAGQWPQGIAPNSGAPGIIFSGNPSFPGDNTDFLATSEYGGIYTFFTQTHFQINSTVPLTNLESLTMQIYMAEGITGAEGGTPQALATAPTMTLTTTAGTFTLNPTYSSPVTPVSVTIFGMATYVDPLDYQWDLSGVVGTPESYTLNWQTAYHSVTYGEDVTESSAVNPSDILVQAVPEPSTISALVGGLGLLLILRRRARPARA